MKGASIELCACPILSLLYIPKDIAITHCNPSCLITYLPSYPIHEFASLHNGLRRCSNSNTGYIILHRF